MKLNFEKYYRDVAKLEITSESKTELHARCPFHSDTTTVSFSASKITGMWKCFGACAEGGSIVQFHMKRFNKPADIAEKDLQVAMGIIPTVPESVVSKAHELLLRSKKMLQFLMDKRGLTLEIIKRFKLGCDVERIFIPILDADGYIVNVRKYLPDFLRKKTSIKMLSWKEGFGSARIYPIENLAQSEILICEGEPDCLLANRLGYAAITVSSGAGTWKDEYTPLFKGKIVNICYDIDKVGQEGALKVGMQLARVAQVRVIKLPITEPAKGDFTDYIVNQGYTKEDFDTLIKGTEFLKSSTAKEASSAADTTVYDVPLNLAGSREYYYKNISMNVIVSGKDLAPYFAPAKLQLTCNMGSHKCKSCVLGLNAGVLDVEFKPSNQELLQMINCTEAQQHRFIRDKLQIHRGCDSFVVNVKEVLNVEEVRVIPELDHSAKDIEYVARQLYYIGYGIKTNRSYKMKGVTLPDPNTQYVTQIITEAIPTQTSIDQFKMTADLMASLKIFQPDKKQSVDDKIKDIATDLSFNVTHIYGREDLITAIDMVYHSVLQFNFQEQVVNKGWCECLVLGDTRCGKTETGQHLIGHYRLGELCTGENVSYAGLVGGMSQQQQRWSISWGKIPLNDRRLVLLDEVSSLDEDMISNMSGMRSAGVAEITKIQNEKTNARTRLIWMSNPRSGRKLDTYNYGILAVKELIGRVEDIARFDIAVTVASSEVDIKLINAMNRVKVPHVYTSDLCNKLILWAWSRLPEQIAFDIDAERLILTKAQELGSKYSPQIPLIEAAEQRIKVAKLSVAVAARLFSTIDGEVILVKPEHVEFAAAFIEKAYSKPSMGYDLFSLAYHQATSLDDVKRQRLEREFKQFSDWFELRELLLEYQAFRKSEISDQMGYELEEQRRLFKWMSINRLIKSTPVGYYKTPVFTGFLKNMKLKLKEGVSNEPIKGNGKDPAKDSKKGIPPARK